jgi:hypothetical protein
MSGSQLSFVYGGRFGAVVGLAVLLAFFWVLAFLSAMDGEWSSVGVCMGACFVLVLIFGLLILSRSDVVVSDQGVARRLWGWTWRTISWSNVDRVTEFPVSKGNGQVVMALNIFPKIKPIHRFTPSGKVFFCLDMRDSSEFIRRLNQNIAEHEIPLTVRHTPLGEPQSAKELLP